MLQTFKQIGPRYFGEVFQLIDATLIQFKIPYYLIGVNAIHLQLLKENIKARGTRDIDFAIMISTIHQFEEIANELEERGFVKVHAPWTFYHEKFDTAIDLLPFGEIEEHYTENFTERFSDLHMLGFKEVLENSREVQVEEYIVQVPPLPGMVILKLIAWSDRPEERQNDLEDILLIIKHFTNLEWERIIMEYAGVIGVDKEFDEMRFAAHVLGCEAGMYLMQSAKIKDRILSVLVNNLGDKAKAPIAIEWARQLDNTVDYAQGLLQRFLDGLNETIDKG